MKTLLLCTALCFWALLVCAAPATAPTVPEKTVSAPDSSERDYWEAMVLFSSPKEADLAKARILLQGAADKEFSPAQFYLGICLQNGDKGFPSQPKKAFSWYQLSAEGGNLFAMHQLGQCYFYGIGVRKNKKLAAKWESAVIASTANSMPTPPPEIAVRLRNPGKAADQGTLSGEIATDPHDEARAEAHLTLGELAAASDKKSEALEHYLKAAYMGSGGRAGHPQAAQKAALIYAFGNGVPRDMKKANELLDLSKQLVNRRATRVAHRMVEQRVLDDFSQADAEDEMAEQTKNAQRAIQTEIAGSFADRRSKNFDAKEAAKWFEIAAADGDGGAMLSLAFLHAEGRLGSASNPEKAFEWFKMASEKGKLFPATANLALCYLRGYGVGRDEAKAMEYFKKHAQISMVCYLGLKGKAPERPINDEEELALTKQWATKQEDPQAMFIMGYRSLVGWGAKQHFPAAIGWFKAASKLKHGPSYTMLGDLCRDMPQLFEQSFSKKTPRNLWQEFYAKGAQAGDAEAYARLGSMYLEGYGVTANLRTASEWFEKCLTIDPSNENGLNNLAVCLQRRWQKERDAGREDEAAPLRIKMIELYRKADAIGAGIATMNLGDLALGGHLDGAGKPDYQSAYTYFEEAASRGIIVAHRRLGRMHEEGLGVPVTYREAAYHYRLSALQNDAQSLEKLSSFYLIGREGISRDSSRALFWLDRLVRAGSSPMGYRAYLDLLIKEGMYQQALNIANALDCVGSAEVKGIAMQKLSLLYEGGLGVKADPDRARTYLRDAADLNNPEALHTQALRLIDAALPKPAIPLLETAVKYGPEIGFGTASYTLACLLMNGTGTAKNEDRAWQLLREAARLGNIDAQFSLALSSLQKKSGAPSLEEAISFARQAEDNGHGKAAAVREQLESLPSAP